MDGRSGESQWPEDLPYADQLGAVRRELELRDEEPPNSQGTPEFASNSDADLAIRTLQASQLQTTKCVAPSSTPNSLAQTIQMGACHLLSDPKGVS